MAPDQDAFPYRSAVAFRAALRDRLTAMARTGGHGLDELHREVAYDRLLARAFTAPDAGSWVLKGAGARLARLPEARHSRDIDLSFATRTAVPPDQTRHAVQQAVASLQSAIDTDLGDFFRFEIQRTSPLQEAAKGRRIHLVAYLGTRYATFHVDVVVGTAMTGTPQPGPPPHRCTSPDSSDRTTACSPSPITSRTSSARSLRSTTGPTDPRPAPASRTWSTSS